MKSNNNLPYADLKKFGIMDEQNQFAERLTKQEQDNFLNGSTLIAENDTTRLHFQLTNGNKELKVDAFEKDLVNHRDLSSGELLELATSDRAFFKAMADHGTITAMGKTHLNENPRNEITYFVEVENERGKTTFYGNDLEEKLKTFKTGDTVQVSQTGVEKTTLQAKMEDGVRDINLYNNTYDVQPLTQENKNVRTKLFEYDPSLKTIVDMDTTRFEYNTVNGVKLTEEQLRQLKRGKEIALDDETSVQLSPSAENPARISSNNRNLLLASMAIDGGMTFLIVKGVQRMHRMIKEKERQKEGAKYKNELEQMQKYLETKAREYPQNKEIVNNLNIVDKELSDVTTRRVNETKQQKNDTSVRIDVNDPDIYKQAERKQERKEEKREAREVKQTPREERPRTRGRGR